MNLAAKKTIQDALGLPTQLRAFLAEKLIETLDLDQEFEISESWKQEIDRRCRN